MVRVASTDAELPLAGKTFVMTGTLPKRTRPEAEALIKKLGGKVTGSVSKSTTYVLAGADPGSKLDKAQQLNIPILDEDGLERLAQLDPYDALSASRRGCSRRFDDSSVDARRIIRALPRFRSPPRELPGPASSSRASPDPAHSKSR